nr:DNA adenine methylase [uncultured Dethiosulfovibrio sp.]
MAPWIISHFPRHNVYVEPFGGAGSVLLRKPRSKYGEVLNDLDADVVNLFRVLRSDMANELIRQVELTPFARDEFDLSREDTDDPVEMARRFLARSYMGRGSCLLRENNGFRSRRSGDKTPPLEWIGMPSAIRRVVERLRGVVIENRPALDVLTLYDGPDVLFYVDPPYPMDTRSKNMLYAYEISNEEHEELAKVLRRLEGNVVLSGYNCPLYDELYQGWTKDQKRALSDGASERIECIWMSPGVTLQGRLFEEIDLKH